MKKSVFVSTILLCLFSVTACGKTAKKLEEKNEVTQKKTVGNNTDLKMETVDLSDPTIEEKWKKEPMYNKTIRVSFEGALCTSGLGISQVQGFFGKEGLNAEVVNIQNTMDAIGTGKVEAITNHISASLVPASNDVDIVFVRGAQTGCRSMYVMNDSEIKSTKDLEEKEVAISGGGIGGHDHNIALRFLFRDKVDWKKVKFKAIDSVATMAAMRNGEVQGAILSDQFAKQFVDKGEIRSIRSITFDDDFKDEPCCTLILNRTFVDQNPITAAKLVRAHKNASYWIEENKSEAAKVLKSHNWGSGDVESDTKFLETYNFKVSDEQMEKTLIDSINDYKEFGILDKNQDTQEILKKVWRPVKNSK